jgi:acetyl-CoA carboxylase carboxyltransferase component
MCGKAYDPRFIFGWPNAKYAVMGAAQASGVIFDIQKRAAEEDAKKHGVELDHAELDRLREQVRSDYEERTDIRWAAAHGWVDAIIAPHTTRDLLITTLGLVKRPTPNSRYKTGVLQT